MSRAKQHSKPVNPDQLRNDRLGTLVCELCEQFSSAKSWEKLVNDFRGPSYLFPDLDTVDHPAAELLRQWRDHGVPAETEGPNWTPEQRDECIR